MRIIETIEELKQLGQIISENGCICYPMWVDNSKHPYNTKLSIIFVISDDIEYIVSLNHTDTLSLNPADVSEVFNTASKIWVFQKKKFIQSLNLDNPNIFDIDTSHFLETGKTIDYETPFQSLITPLIHNGYRDDLIQSIPVFKLGEVIQKIIYNYSIDNTNYNFKWFNDIVIPTLSKIEQHGLRVDVKKFIDSFPSFPKTSYGTPKHITPNGRIYTEYNPYTVTGRPSNRHGGVNFSALNKSDGSRESFVSDGVFLQMDYDAFHPRIIGALVGYELPKTSVHQWLAEQYGCELKEAKGITFQLLYGGIPDEFKEIEYYAKVAEFIQRFWENCTTNGYIQTKYRRIPLSWVEEPNPQKVFNYLLQAIETEMNIDTIDLVLKRIEGTDVKLVLYTYDSFLLDCPLSGDIECLRDVKGIIERNGFPVKADWGENYGKF